MPDGAAGLSLSAQRKAAIIVQTLITEGVDLDLKSLPPDAQVRLTREIAQMGSVDRVTVDLVIEDFLSGLEGFGVAGAENMGAALAKLSSNLSEDAVTSIREEMGQRVDPWTKIAELEEERLLAILRSEAVEVSAIVITKLEVPQAARLLERLEGPRARLITFSMGRVAEASIPFVEELGTAIVSCYCGPQARAFDIGQDKTLGAILTASAAQTRTSLLGDLAQDAPEFAEQVKRNIFTFADLPDRLAPPDVPKAVKEIDQQVLVTALAYSETLADGVADYLLSNMSKRMAEQIREEMGDISPDDKAGEAAQSEVVNVISAAAERGDVTLFAER